MTQKYVEKPRVVEAVRFTAPASKELLAWLGEAAGEVSPNEIEILGYEEGHGWQPRESAAVGDWIIKNIYGHFYSEKPDIFDATYAEAPE